LLHKSLPFYTRLRAKAYVNDLRDEFDFESDVHTRTWVEFLRNGIRAPHLHVLSIPPTREAHESGASARRKDRSDKTSGNDSKFNMDSQNNSGF
jgi:hypothetical protein